MSIRHCNLTVVPDVIGRFHNLRTVDFTGNRISVLPSSFERLDRVETLVLEDNLFREVPAALDLLFHLTDLNMADNRVAHLAIWHLPLHTANFSDQDVEEMWWSSSEKNDERPPTLCASASNLMDLTVDWDRLGVDVPQWLLDLPVQLHAE